jgi:hypothetical protein
MLSQTKYNQGNYTPIDTMSYQEDLNRHQHSYENLRSSKIELLENNNHITMQYTAK